MRLRLRFYKTEFWRYIFFFITLHYNHVYSLYLLSAEFNPSSPLSITQRHMSIVAEHAISCHHGHSSGLKQPVQLEIRRLTGEMRHPTPHDGWWNWVVSTRYLQTEHTNLCTFIWLHTMAKWRKALDLRSISRVFNCHRDKAALHRASCSYLCASVTKQYNVILIIGQWRSLAGKVTAGLAESNGSLLPGNDLESHGGWLPVLLYTGISSGPNAR